jgi:hypothetical protein
LIDNKIVVNTGLISTVDENEPLRAICELTGRLAFRTKMKEEGLFLFEQEAFLNITIRKRYRVGATPVTRAIFAEQLGDFSNQKYAVNAENHIVEEAEMPFLLELSLYAIRQALQSTFRSG